MRSYFLFLGLLFGAIPATWAQTATTRSYPGDAAVVYQWAHSNTQPGDCGCFHANGVGFSGSLHVATRWAAVAEVSAEFASKGPQTGNTLTLASFLAGARYRLPQNFTHMSHPLQPYVQVLVGAAHAGGGIAGAGDGTVAFAARVGGGLEVSLTSSIAVRIVEADYFPTDFANAANGHQNNLLLASGIVYRRSSEK